MECFRKLLICANVCSANDEGLSYKQVEHGVIVSNDCPPCVAGTVGDISSQIRNGFMQAQAGGQAGSKAALQEMRR